MQGSFEDPGLVPRTLDTVFNSIGSHLTLKYVIKPNGHNGFEIQSEAEAIMDRQRLEYSVKRTPMKGDYALSALEHRLVETAVIPISQQYLYAVFISYVELYNDVIYDLLDPTNSGKSLSLYEDANKNTYVNGVTEMEVKTSNEALQAYYRGQQRRRVGSTILNNESSRSHGIFFIRIVRTGYDQTYDEVIMDKNLLSVSQLCLVDLAGSERTCRSGTAGTRLKEASTINKSLMSLRQCIDVLRSNQGAKSLKNSSAQLQIVPYRDCKLTRIFKSFFDGRGQVAILVCIHPTAKEFSETTQVLQFAESSQQVTTVIPPTPVRTEIACERSSSSADLMALNNSILESIATLDSLDTKLRGAGSFFKSDSLEEFMTNVGCTCGCAEKGRRRSSKLSRCSTMEDVHHSSSCSFLSLLQVRIDERKKLRELLSRFDTQANASLDNFLRRAENDSSRTLADALEKSKGEALQLDLKMRYLENEVARLRTLRSQERNDHDRELTGTKAQVKRLKEQLASLQQMPRSTPRVKRAPRGSISSTSTTDDIGPSRYNLRKVPVIPSTMNRVALLSHQWETRLAKEKQETPVARRGDRRSMSRSRTEVALAEATNRPPAMNPRHRRSKSVGGDASVWLEHREDRPAPLGTILSPTGINVRKSATKISLQDTLKATNYLLHHQTSTPDGDLETKLYKGSIIPTAGGGSAVVFNDVEELRQVSPLNTSLRRSSRLSAKRELSATLGEDAIENIDKENEVLGNVDDMLPPRAKRRASSTHKKRSSLISTTSGISTAMEQTEDDDDDDKSYKTITPPAKDKYLGFSYTGGISGVYKH
nr:kinesin protein kif23 [Hymenolepis microstoma]